MSTMLLRLRCTARDLRELLRDLLYFLRSKITRAPFFGGVNSIPQRVSIHAVLARNIVDESSLLP